jgi:tripartite ATP-independent transporter DctM subunit
MMTVLIFGFFGMVALGVPIAFAIGSMAVIGLLIRGDVSLTIVVSRIFGSLDSFTLLSVPFFVLAGALFDTGGIARRLMEFARVLVGHVRGGLGMTTVTGEMFFSGISGSTTADAAAIGSVMIPTMVRTGYSPARAAAIVCAASGMGILVPPCVTMVVYGGMTNTSIAALFAAGFVPALVMAAGLMLHIHIEARRTGLPRQARAAFADIWRAFKQAGYALLMPLIIFGGILGGVFTPTEAAVVAVVYGLVIGLFVYREITFGDVCRILTETGIVTGAVMFLLATAGVFGWLLTIMQLPQAAAEFLAAIGGKTAFLLLTIVFFFVLFAILDGLPAMIMVVPIFLPIATTFGVDLVHFGIIITALMGIALFMPPLGVGLYVTANIARCSAGAVGSYLLPYLANMFVVTLIITFVPAIVLIVPHLLGYAVRF